MSVVVLIMTSEWDFSTEQLGYCAVIIPYFTNELLSLSVKLINSM